MLKLTNFKWCLAMLLSLAFANVFSQNYNCTPSVDVYSSPDKNIVCEGTIIKFVTYLGEFATVDQIQWYIGEEPVGTKGFTVDVYETKSSSFAYIAKLSDNGKKVKIKVTGTNRCDGTIVNSEGVTYNSIQIIDIQNPPMLDLYPKFFCHEGANQFSVPYAPNNDFSAFSWYVNDIELGYPQELSMTDKVQLKYKMSENAGCPSDFYLESNIAYYNPDCSKKGEMPENPSPITIGANIADNVNNYKKGRENQNATCTTGKDNDNVIDIFYYLSNGWDIYDNGFEMVIQLADPSYEVSLEFVDSVANSITCLENISTNLNSKKFRIEPKSLNQYVQYTRLEIGADSPLGHARVQATNGEFSVKVSSSITAVENETNAFSKKIVSTYNMLGVEVDSNYKGLVIHKFDDGSTQKLIKD